MGIFRRTLTRSSASSSASSSSTHSPVASGSTTPTGAAAAPLSTSPTAPALTLTKTHSRLGLTKTLTWGRRREEDKQRRKIENWEHADQNEWNAPTGRRPGRKVASKQHQDLLRAFEWKMPRSSLEGGRSRSVFSGISPGCSRMNSIDDLRVGLQSKDYTNGRGSLAVQTGGCGGPLSRQTSRSEGDLRSVVAV